MNMPNFLIIGAAKAGTTSLHFYLKQHPQIYMSRRKEANFFANKGESDNREFRGLNGNLIRFHSITNIEDYQAQFQGVLNEKAIGEASPMYLYDLDAATRIQQYIPNAKLIAILRDPSERSFSHFSHFVRDGIDPITDFSQALKEVEVRSHNNLPGSNYIRYGLYFTHLKHYFERFDRDQIRIYLYEDLKANPLHLLQNIFQFLNVDSTFVPNMYLKYNVSGFPKNKILHRFLTEIFEHDNKFILKMLLPEKIFWKIGLNLYNMNLKKLQMSPEIRKQLIKIYRDDILQLQDLIQRDLSKWLE